MDPKQWTYAGEGGKHALFVFDGGPTEPMQDEFVGKLLRIVKQDLASSVRMCAKHDDTHKLILVGQQKNRVVPDDGRIEYTKRFIVPMLTKYVDVPRVIAIGWSFLKALRDEAIASGHIPDSRKDDWMLHSGDSIDVTTDETSVNAHLIIDYKKLHVPRNLFTGLAVLAPLLSIELKPKAGYDVVSPLVHPNRRIKYMESRFVSLQRLHQMGKVKKGWTNSTADVVFSRYNPLDLFSQSELLIEKSLRALMDTPQNNLRVWLGDRLLSRDDAEGSAITCNFLEALQIELPFQTHGDHMQYFSNAIVEVLKTIFTKEDILSRLLELQKLDIVDADGAILLYERLVELYDGDKERVERIIDTVPAKSETSSSAEDTDIPFMPLSTSMLPQPTNSTELQAFVKLLNDCKTIVGAKPLHMTKQIVAELDDIHIKAVEIVERLTEEECLYLLRNWMLSLAMCDVSIFVSAQFANANVDPHETRLPDNIKKGVVTIDDSGTVDHEFIYRVKVVDFDQKPSKKLRTRHKKELAFEVLKNSLY